MITAFGEIVRTIQKKYDLTNKEIAYEMGVYPTSLSAMVNGFRNPSPYVIERLIKTFDLHDSTEQIYEAARVSAVSQYINLYSMPTNKVKLVVNLNEKLESLTDDQVTRMLDIMEECQNESGN